MPDLHVHSPLRRATVIVAGIVLGIIAATAVILGNRPAPSAGGYLPKDVPETPAASPLSSAPPGSTTVLKSDAVTVALPAGSPVGPGTAVTGTAAAPDGTVYYRIDDYRHGQIAAGEVGVAAGDPAGGSRPFSFQPKFGRTYTAGDPATLDVYTLNAAGAEQLTRIPITLR